MTRRDYLEAGDPTPPKGDRKTLRLVAQDTPLQFAEQGDAKLPTVSMVAYTGAAMRFWAFDAPVVVDLKGYKAVAKSRPLLKDHNPAAVVGHTTRVEVEAGQRLIVEGVLSGGNAVTAEVIASAKNGFPWQASIGAPVQRMEFVRAGVSVKVNGRTFQGPLYVAREWTLSETSIVALGADDDTESRIAARRQGGDMGFDAWLRAKGFDPDQLSDDQKSTLEAAYKAENKPEKPAKPAKDPADEGVEIVRAKAAAENKRIAEVSEIAAEYPTIRAKAIEEGWNPTQTELEVLKAQRPTVNGIVKPGRHENQAFTPEVVEAGVLASLGVSDSDRLKIYGERTLEAARPYERIGLKDLVMLSFGLEKKEAPRVWGDGEIAIKAAFSTMSLPGILENSINKLALLAYRAAEIQALQFCRIGSTPDFKKVSRVRMLGTGRFERIGKAGELTSGKIGEQKFENQADTYGQVVAIDRQTIMNDDLMVLSDAGAEIGYTGAEVVNQLAAEKLLGAGSFFATGNGNLITGAAASAFGETGLTNANTAFRKQKAGPGTKDKDQRPINIQPEILLVPPELEVRAQILTGSAEIRPGGGADRGEFNPWRGRYRVISMPHLSDTGYSDNSATAWYLLANPNRLPALELLFVGGRREPQVERIPLPGQQLGIGIRGYLDVGCELMDPKGILKATGVD